MHDERIEDLMKLSPEAILLRWVNHHLERAGTPRYNVQYPFLFCQFLKPFGSHWFTVFNLILLSTAIIGEQTTSHPTSQILRFILTSYGRLHLLMLM